MVGLASDPVWEVCPGQNRKTRLGQTIQGLSDRRHAGSGASGASGLGLSVGSSGDVGAVVITEYSSGQGFQHRTGTDSISLAAQKKDFGFSCLRAGRISRIPNHLSYPAVIKFCLDFYLCRRRVAFHGGHPLPGGLGSIHIQHLSHHLHFFAYVRGPRRHRPGTFVPGQTAGPPPGSGFGFGAVPGHHCHLRALVLVRPDHIRPAGPLLQKPGRHRRRPFRGAWVRVAEHREQFHRWIDPPVWQKHPAR